nr:transcription factor bHLH30-like [Ipomoea batatas]GMD09103.1 transcription factor bHLH30-like [Ipomoea batatas]
MAYGGMVDQFVGDLGEASGNWGNGSKGVSQSLVLDSEKCELVKTCGVVRKKGGDGASGVKTTAALKSHSEAERRRRERINAHLATLRSLVPSNEKMDKAALLAEVIRQVKQLKETARQVSDSLFLPMDSDEIQVEQVTGTAGDGTRFFQASICCDYRPELLSDLRQCVDSLGSNLVKSEISILGGRVKCVFFFRDAIPGSNGRSEAWELLMRSIHQTLRSVLEKDSKPPEYSKIAPYPNKRHRISSFNSAYLA